MIQAHIQSSAQTMLDLKRGCSRFISLLLSSEAVERRPGVRCFRPTRAHCYGSQQPSACRTRCCDRSCPPPPPSDLVGMYAHENFVNLTRYALPLEEFVRQEEEQSARLEATLLPQYNANGERAVLPMPKSGVIFRASAMLRGAVWRG